ncbi:MAG TPA: hypothetical protein VGP68_21160 [Gemmataceae bacterium]|nr:hypothetical protein [Gemmataceae bacterium]
MLYKTITLGLLQDQPQMYDQLLSNGTLLQTLERYASELRNRHLTWKELLTQAKPDSNPMLIASEALELATQELMSDSPFDQPQNDDEPLSLDGAMTFIRRQSNPA